MQSCFLFSGLSFSLSGLCVLWLVLLAHTAAEAEADFSDEEEKTEAGEVSGATHEGSMMFHTLHVGKKTFPLATHFLSLSSKSLQHTSKLFCFGWVIPWQLFSGVTYRHILPSNTYPI